MTRGSPVTHWTYPAHALLADPKEHRMSIPINNLDFANPPPAMELQARQAHAEQCRASGATNKEIADAWDALPADERQRRIADAEAALLARVSQPFDPTAEDEAPRLAARHLDDLIDRWHEGEGSSLSLHKWLGVTWENYVAWATGEISALELWRTTGGGFVPTRRAEVTS